jgi:hypothetical protein
MDGSRDPKPAVTGGKGGIGRWEKFVLFMVLTTVSSPPVTALLMLDVAYLQSRNLWLMSFGFALCALTAWPSAGMAIYRFVSTVAGAGVATLLITYGVMLQFSDPSVPRQYTREGMAVPTEAESLLLAIAVLAFARSYALRSERDLETQELWRRLEEHRVALQAKLDDVHQAISAQGSNRRWWSFIRGARRRD